MPRITEETDFLVQYELFSVDNRTEKLSVRWVDGTSYDRYEAAVRDMEREIVAHSKPEVAHKYGNHRLIRRVTTVVDYTLYFPQPGEGDDPITLATPLEEVRDKMSTRLYNALQWNAPHTGNGPVLLAHVVACDEPFWFRAPNLGRTTMNELKSFLRDNNLPKLGTLPIKKEF